MTISYRSNVVLLIPIRVVVRTRRVFSLSHYYIYSCEKKTP